MAADGVGILGECVMLHSELPRLTKLQHEATASRMRDAAKAKKRKPGPIACRVDESSESRASFLCEIAMPEQPSRTFAAAQISALRGDVTTNLATHLEVMERAAAEGADLLVFPELSLTGYELDLGESLQTTPDDPLFAPLQALAAEHGMLTLIGAPLKAPSGKPFLGAVVLGGAAPLAYAKMHVHVSEAGYFQSGPGHEVIEHKGARVGCAICADLTHASHPAGAHALGADVYAVGALIDDKAFAREAPMLEGHARDHGMTVVFANYASKSGAYTPIGKSSIWAPGGALVIEAQGTEETLVIARHVRGDWQGKRLSL